MIDALAGPALSRSAGAKPIVTSHGPQALRVPQHVSLTTGASMALEAIAMEGPEARVSDQVARLIATYSRSWERFFVDNANQAPRFVPSVPERVWAVLAEVTARQLPPTRVFCEWGSGFGTATCLAALLGYEAYGLEIDEELVRRSRALAQRLGIPVRMLCTSFFPAGDAASAGDDGAALVTPASVSAHHATAETRAPLRYAGMESTIADIGLFFAYPWPEERALMRQLFEAVARVGALLVVYHTDTDFRVWRKVEREGELEDPRTHEHRP
jgi:hypothetical protein